MFFFVISAIFFLVLWHQLLHEWFFLFSPNFSQSSSSSQQAVPSKVSQVDSESPIIEIPKDSNPNPLDQTRTQTDTRIFPFEHSPPIIQMIRCNCIVCSKVAMYLCSSCKKVWYCSTKCQVSAAVALVTRFDPN